MVVPTGFIGFITLEGELGTIGCPYKTRDREYSYVAKSFTHLLWLISLPSKCSRDMRVGQAVWPRAGQEVRRGSHSLDQGVTVHSRGYIK